METMTEKDAIEVVSFAKQSMRSEYDQKGLSMAIASLEVCGKLKEVGYCHTISEKDRIWWNGLTKLIS